MDKELAKPQKCYKKPKFNCLFPGQNHLFSGNHCHFNLLLLQPFHYLQWLGVSLKMFIQRRCIDSCKLCKLCMIIWDLFCCIVSVFIIRTLESLRCQKSKKKWWPFNIKGSCSNAWTATKTPFFASDIRSEKWAIVSIILAQGIPV